MMAIRVGMRSGIRRPSPGMLILKHHKEHNQLLLHNSLSSLASTILASLCCVLLDMRPLCDSQEPTREPAVSSFLN
jgi:hypothetical protein